MAGEDLPGDYNAEDRDFNEAEKESNWSVDTPRGKKNISIKVTSKGSTTDVARKSVRATGTLVKEEADKSVKSNRMSGDVNASASVKPNSRNERKNVAKKKTGLVYYWEVYNDPGYIEAEKRDSEDTVLKDVNLKDTYRGSARFLEVKDKYPIASIQILSRKNGEGRLSSGGYKTILPPYTRFMLTDVQLSSREKYELYTTFKSFRVNFFDSGPEVWNYSGVLLNTENQNWSTDFRNLYHTYLRGTQCAKIGAECYITFGDIISSGLILGMGINFSSSNPNMVPVSFQLLVTNEFVYSTSQLTNVLQKKISPSSEKDQPSLVFDILRNNYAREYGSKEKRSGVITDSNVINNLDKNSELYKEAKKELDNSTGFLSDVFVSGR